METSGHSNVNPTIKYLTEIIDDISKGELRVPNFQRPFVWKPSDIISLFDSIYKGYPIGSLLFWETSQKLQSFTQIGPFDVILSNKSETNYVLDGHQRLSTLYGVLHSKKSLPFGEAIGWHLSFDLEKEEFVFPNAKDSDLNLISMDKIVNTLDFLEECKRIQNANPNSSNQLINKAQKLAQSIITYKLTITQIKGGNLSSAVEIFSRLNTKGLDMTPDQMLSALTYEEGSSYFKLADKIDEILEKLIEFKFSEIERIFIFRAIIAASKRDIYNVKLEDLANDKKIKLASIVEKCEVSILQAAKFLFHNLNVPGDKLLPYNLQFVFISEFFFTEPAPKDYQLKELEKWFWFTSYSGWFAGANTSKVRKGLDDIRAFAKGKSNELSYINYANNTAEFPDKFDFRYARVKSFVLFLLSLNPLPLEEGQDYDVKNLLSEAGYKALHHILPHENNNFGNRMILAPIKFGFAKHLLSDPSKQISGQVLASHGITQEAYTAFQQHKFIKFIRLREQELVNLETEFIQSKGLNYTIPLPIKNDERGQLHLFATFG